MVNIEYVATALCLMFVLIAAGCDTSAKLVPITGSAMSEAGASGAERDEAPTRESSGYPAIGHLKMRDHTITILSGPEGPCYTVKSKSGEVILWQGSDQDFEARHPELHRRVKGGLAGPLWAGN